MPKASFHVITALSDVVSEEHKGRSSRRSFVLYFKGQARRLIRIGVSWIAVGPRSQRESGHTHEIVLAKTGASEWNIDDFICINNKEPGFFEVLLGKVTTGAITRYDP